MVQASVGAAHVSVSICAAACGGRVAGMDLSDEPPLYVDALPAVCVHPRVSGGRSDAPSARDAMVARDTSRRSRHCAARYAPRPTVLRALVDGAGLLFQPSRGFG